MWMTSISFKLPIIVLLAVIEAQGDSSACEKREKDIALLDLAKESISKAKDVQPACGSDSKDVSSNSSECGAKEKVSANLDIARNLIEEVKQNYSTCDAGKNATKEFVILHENPADCSDILKNGAKSSGPYAVWPRHPLFINKSIEVYCDMDTHGGGWTVIQRRGQFSKKVDFRRDWNDYKQGFGNISEEFWMGNDIISVLTSQGNYTLRFDLENVGKKHLFATYPFFWIGNETTKYTLHFGNYNGTAGDGLKTAKNVKFSTSENSNSPAKNCAKSHFGGWWYNNCGHSNPNGVNQPRIAAGYTQKCMFWYPWTRYESLQAIEIKMRREN